jgi:hypothetical protein
MLTELEKTKLRMAEDIQRGRKEPRTYPNVKQPVPKETYNKVVAILKGVHFKKGLGRVLTTGFLDADDCKITIEHIIQKLELKVKIDGFRENFYSIKSVE